MRLNACDELHDHENCRGDQRPPQDPTGAGMMMLVHRILYYQFTAGAPKSLEPRHFGEIEIPYLHCRHDHIENFLAGRPDRG
jgi:hypothetical protein